VRCVGGLGLAIALLTASCAAVEDVTRQLPAATRPIKYRLAGADPELGRNLDQGWAQLKDGNHLRAVGALNRALWDLERIETRWLRLEDLAEAHRALADAYGALRRGSWADDHRRLSQALAESARRDPPVASPEATLGRGRDAYARAQFRDAVIVLGQAVVDLEAVTYPPARVKLLEEVRCYLAFAYFALDELDRARDELERVWALDPSLSFCAKMASPAIRRLIADVQRQPGPR